MKKVYQWLICITVLLAISSVAVYASANNSKKNAQEITEFDEPVLGTISKAKENDWYQFTTGEEYAYYYFTLNNESGTTNAHLVVYNAKDAELLNLGYYTGQGQSIDGNIRLDPNSTYYVKIFLNDEGTGNYSFKISKKVDEVFNTQDQSTEIAAGEMYYQSIDGAGDTDWFVLTSGDQEAYFHMYLKNESGTGNAQIVVFNERDAQMISLGYYTGAGAEISGNFRVQPNSKYYLVASMGDTGVGNYCFQVTEKTDEVGDDKENAKEFSLNKLVTSSIEGDKDADFFVLKTGDVTREYQVILNNISGTSSAYVSVYTERDEKLLDVGYFTYAGETATGNVTLQANSTYYFRAGMGDTGSGEYSFKVTQCVDGHTPSEAWKTSSAPTCTTKGMSEQVCSICGEVVETKEIDETGHIYQEWKVIKEATMVSLGKKSATCTQCGEIGYKNDWSKAWILPAIIVGGIALLIGIINYVKAYSRSKRYR